MTEVTYNVLNPTLMSEQERHAEIAQILAHGIARLCNQAAQEVTQERHLQLAMPGKKSVHSFPSTAALKAAALVSHRHVNR